jgi:hypothetical protein
MKYVVISVGGDKNWLQSFLVGKRERKGHAVDAVLSGRSWPTFLFATCFLLVTFLAYFSTLMMEAVHSFETSLNFFTARHRILKESTPLTEMVFFIVIYGSDLISY